MFEYGTAAGGTNKVIRNDSEAMRILQLTQILGARFLFNTKHTQNIFLGDFFFFKYGFKRVRILNQYNNPM